MNMLYEGLKHNATILIVPSTVVETMQLGTVAGLTALTKAQPKNNRDTNAKVRAFNQEDRHVEGSKRQ